MMQSFNFGIRNSNAPSVDDNASRYVPSSIYSGPGPAEESPLPVQQPQNGTRAPAVYGKPEQRFHPTALRPRTSMMLNMNDPISMHLLMETAMMDSKDFEVLSFEELEHLKKERGYLKTKIEGVRRQLGLERKMKDAAQSLNRLYSTKKNKDELHLDVNSEKTKKSSIFSRKSQQPEKEEKIDDEVAASNQRIDTLSVELGRLERTVEDVERRIMHHTAGILQMTHRGLKKNVRKNELPRSPESMTSQARSVGDGSSDFDERSLYQVPDYVHDLGTPANQARRFPKDQPLEDVSARLQDLNVKIHGLIQQAPTAEHFERPPLSTEPGLSGRVGAQIQAHLTYMLQALEALEIAQDQMLQGHHDGGGNNPQVEELNNRLNEMLARTNSVARSPTIPQQEDFGHDLGSQLAFSSTVLDRLNVRIDALLEQKDILTRQIQQQRELNTKSDAQRDAQIRDLTEELEEAKQEQTASEQELHQAQNQISLLIEQLDEARSSEALLDRQKGMQESNALEAERAAKKEVETRLLAELESKQQEFTQLQADHSKIQHDFELRSQHHIQQMNELIEAKEQHEIESRKNVSEFERVQGEMAELESQVVNLQTELTMAKAELDGAYGSRQERAKDVAMNPEIRRQMDELNTRNMELQQQLEHLSNEHETKGAGSAELQNKVNALQQELKETIEDYEIMTKTSIDSEKEREQLEETIDTLRDKCEGLETQINEDKVKWLGVKSSLPPETTSTMVLKNEFKKMMKDSRSESIKTIRAEQEERKRLESIIKTMKREANQNAVLKAPSRSATMPDSPSVVA